MGDSQRKGGPAGWRPERPNVRLARLDPGSRSVDRHRCRGIRRNSQIEPSAEVEYPRSLYVYSFDNKAPLRIKRVWIRRVCAVSVFAFLLAQISLTVYACPGLSKIAGAAAERASMPCADMDPQQPSVCHEHCKDQAGVDHVQLPGVPPAMAMAHALVTPLIDAHRAVMPASCAGPDPARVTGPPPSILFCVFRT